MQIIREHPKMKEISKHPLHDIPPVAVEAVEAVAVPVKIKFSKKLKKQTQPSSN